MIDDAEPVPAGEAAEPYLWTPPRTYACRRFRGASPDLERGLADPAWSVTNWSEPFVDILGEDAPAPVFPTRFKAGWDDEALWIAAELTEPHLFATLTEHDSVIFQDPDFEVFLDPDGDSAMYVELEMNALNTTWDLLLPRAYRVGGPPVDGFELAGLRTAVVLHGTLNDSTDVDRSWEALIRIPWRALAQVAGCPCPPKTGDRWRINFSRVQWDLEPVEGGYRKVPGRPEHNWVWSPQGVVDMHQPERWGFFRFLGADDPDPGPAEVPPSVRSLYAFAHRELARRREGIPGAVPVPDGMRFHATPHQFTAECGGYRIDHELRLTRSEPR